jgi:hypothetical protein
MQVALKAPPSSVMRVVRQARGAAAAIADQEKAASILLALSPCSTERDTSIQLLAEAIAKGVDLADAIVTWTQVAPGSVEDLISDFFPAENEETVG